MREATMYTLGEMMERAELLGLSMMDMTFAMGALGMISDEQFQVMDEWATQLRSAWGNWKRTRSHTSEKMWTNMGMLGLGGEREFRLLNKDRNVVRKVWKRRPIGLTA
jgi:hypothetical protein